jgi:hypothetical protein
VAIDLIAPPETHDRADSKFDDMKYAVEFFLDQPKPDANIERAI